MKGGKNPTREQKELLAKKKKDWRNWLIVKVESDKYIFKNKTSGNLLTIAR